MRIALVADVFPPLRSSGAVQLRDLAQEFVRQGHQITVMVAAPELKTAWELEDISSVEVLRLRTPRTRDRGYVLRTVAEYLMPFSMLSGLRQSPRANDKFDAVVWYSPTIFLGPMVKALKKYSQCPAYLIIRDIFPEWAWEMGLIPSKVLFQWFRKIAHSQYSQADVIGIQTPGNEIYFKKWKAKKPDVKIEVLHNWLSQAPNVGCSINVNQTKLKGRKIFIYAGNMGIAQNTDIFCRLAERFQDRDNVGFLFVGRGSERVRLESLYSHLPNILFCDEVAPEEIPGLYEQCQIGLVALDPRHQSHNIPGKFLSYIQSGLAVLACVNKNNDLIQLIQAHGVGVAVDSDSADIYLDQQILKILELSQDPTTAKKAKQLTLNMFSSESAVRQIISS